jgi:hypothetical protein
MSAFFVFAMTACQSQSPQNKEQVAPDQADLNPPTVAPKPKWEVAKRMPVYELFTLTEGKLTSNKDLAFIAQNFQLMHGKLSEAQIDYMHGVNPNFTALAYINSGSNTTKEQVIELEKQRDGIAMFVTALLTEGIDETATSFTVQDPPGLRAQQTCLDVFSQKPSEPMTVSLKASTMPGVYNDARHNATSQYVTWLRLDDEWMRIEEYDESTHVVRVSRAFDGSTAASHAAGSPVFAPTYLGSSNSQSAYPGGKKPFLRYAFDIGKPLAAQWMADKTLEAIGQGYDGAWFDVFESINCNTSDFQARAVNPWNFSTGKPYTHVEGREGQENRVAKVFDYVHDKTGEYPALYANSIRPGNYYFTGLNTVGTLSGGMKNMLLPTPRKPRPVDGYCIENFVGTYAANPQGKIFETQGEFQYGNPDKWRSNVKMLADAAQSGIRLMPIAGDAGADIANLDVDTQWRADFEEFAYASYLLGVEKGGKTLFGTAAFYREADGSRHAGLSEQYYWPIGYPTETKKPDRFDEYKLHEHVTYIRHFANGIVLVNPERTADTVIKLDREYLDPKTGEKVMEVTMGAKQGRILLIDNPQE